MLLLCHAFIATAAPSYTTRQVWLTTSSYGLHNKRVEKVEADSVHATSNKKQRGFLILAIILVLSYVGCYNSKVTVQADQLVSQ